MILRPYQSIAMADVQNAYRAGKRAPLLCSPTGSGKSAMTKYMLGKTKKSVLYLCHREPLMEMISDDLKDAGIPHGLIAANSNALPNTYKIHVGMMQTVAKRLDRLPQFDWVISDEAHLAMSPTWASILGHYNKSWHLGMSATPCRLDGKGLGAFYDEIVYGPSIRELTDRGYLAPCRVFAPPVDIDTTGAVRKLSLDSASQLLNTPAITGSAIAEMRKLAPGRQAVVFCTTREHAESVANQFRMEGFTAAAVDGSMPRSEQKIRIADFKARRTQILVTVDLLTTGWDCPQVEVAIFLRFTESLALFLQMIGRILRISPGKTDAVLLDHVGNVVRHGMPDADREWTLDGREKRASAPPVRQCGKCYAVFAPAPKCPSCGYTIPVASKPRALVQRSGDLEEVTEAEIAARRQSDIKAALSKAVSLRDFQDVAKQFGNKPGWAFKMHEIYSKNRRRRAA